MRYILLKDITVSVQFSCSVVSNSLWPHRLQHTRPPCPSPTPRAHSNSCPSSWWCHPTILSSVVPFSFCLQSFPESGSFPVSQLFTLGGQSIGVSASASVLPMNNQDGLVGSPCSPRDSQKSSPIPHQERRKREDFLRELHWKQGDAVINSTLSDQLCNFKRYLICCYHWQ